MSSDTLRLVVGLIVGAGLIPALVLLVRATTVFVEDEEAVLVTSFGKLVATETGNLAGAAAVLAKGLTDREIADYGGGMTLSAMMVRDATKEARKFVDACAAHWGLRMSRP